MTERDFLAEAKAQIEAEAAAHREGEIAGRAGRLAHEAFLAETHARLCARHGLQPETTTPKALARAERLYDQSWRSYVLRAGGFLDVPAMHVLDPDNGGLICPGPDNPMRLAGGTWVPDTQKIKLLHERRAELLAKFSASWPPADLLERLHATDGTEQLFSHIASAA